MEELEDDLIGKIVMTNEGILFGEICESLIDAETGIPDKIKVKPLDECSNIMEDSEELIFNSSSFIQVKDIVIIEQD